MRHRLTTATSVLVLCMMTAAHAVEINQDGANTIRDNLNNLLPGDMAKAGVVAVKPAGTRYEIIYDFAKLLAKIKGDFAVNGLTPMSAFATPQDSGLWNLEGVNSLNISGHFNGPDKKRTDFTYSIGSMVYNSVFDPAISYLRSGDFTAKDIKVTSATDTELVNASFGDMQYKLTSVDSASAGRLDYAANGTLNTFAEQVSGKEMPPIQITADSLDFDAKVAGLPAKKLKDIVVFILDHAEQKQLSKEGEAEIKAMLGEAFPLISSLEETIKLNNLAVTSAAGGGGAKTFGYHLAIDGPSNATRLGVAIDASDVTLDSPLVPAAYTAFLPQAVDIQFGVPGMDFAAFSDEFMKLDLSKAAGDGEKAGQQAAGKLFPNGRLTIDFPKISAKSNVYDIDISGTIEGRIDTQKDYKMNASILVRDYDKTIAAIQELAKTNPDLSQASFGLLMVKGFAKTDPDGRQRWDVAVDSDGSVNVNGQQIKGPDEPKP